MPFKLRTAPPHARVHGGGEEDLDVGVGQDGVEVVDDSGVVEDIEGAAMSDAELLAHRRREFELLSLAG